MRLLTLTTNFKIPFARDILLSLGLCDVSKESLNYILSQVSTSFDLNFETEYSEEILLSDQKKSQLSCEQIFFRVQVAQQ